MGSASVHQCEWCADQAIWCYFVKPDYQRFACDAHAEKTRRLMFLDRGPSVAYEVRRVPGEADHGR